MGIRYRILEKLAQQTDELPTEGVAKTQVVAGNPPSFIPSNLYPGMILAFSERNAAIINGLASLLNNGLYYSSNGQVSLSSMKANNFSAGTSHVPSSDLRNLMNFSKAIYQNLFTNLGINYDRKLSSEEIKEIVDNLKNNQYLNNLPATNPTGQLGTKIGGNLKTLMINYLSNIK